MTAKTHMLGGALAGELALLSIGDVSPSIAALLIGGSVAGSLVPDIDHVNSKISRSSVAAKVTSFAVSGVTHHRGMIHTPLFILACALLLSSASFFGLANGWWLTVALALGMLSHLILDTLNPSGIMWLWPLSKKRYNLLTITTNSLGEWLVTGVLAVIVLWLAMDYLPAIMGSIRRLIPRLPDFFEHLPEKFS